MREYWIVSPEDKTVQVYTLSNGVLMPREFYGSGDVAKVNVLDGCFVELGKDILDARLGGDPDRSFRLLWVDELAAMVTGLEKKQAEFVKNAVASILQTGRSLNCQILVSVQRGDSAYFNNGAKEDFGNLVFLGPHISKEAAAMFGVDRATLPPVAGRAGYYIVNGNTEAIQPIQVPIIKGTTKLHQAILAGVTR